MRVKEPSRHDDFVRCPKCKETIVIEATDKLRQKVQDGKKMFYLFCPMCGNKIKFNELMRYTDEGLINIRLTYPVDKAVRDHMEGRICSFSKDAICTLSKSGGNDRLRPSVQIKNKK